MPASAAFLKAQIEGKNPEDYVFTQANGQPWSERNLPERFRSYREKAELEGWDVDLHLKLTQDLHLILTHPERQIMA